MPLLPMMPPSRYLLHIVLLLSLAIAMGRSAVAQDVDLSFLQTRAEATDYEQTTRYNEVRAFLDVVDRVSDRIHLTHFGYTTEGRSLPLAVFGDVEEASPEAVQASGKTRVFVMANIHAGEVCGKEAMLMLLRALAAGQHAAWADSLVVLVAPIYNADGNERVSLYHRDLQHGPIGGMGQRPNAQGYDLNRDHMKLDSPEARSLVRFFTHYDPHVVVDLHTTNGSYHAYHLTYAPPLHPSTDTSIVRFLRERWLPTVTETMKQKYGALLYYYGYHGTGYFSDASDQEGWYTFSHRPRFNNNYAGLRNRFGILSEAYAYLPFKERVLVTLHFVEELLNVAYRHASAIRRITKAADAHSVVGESMALRAEHARSDEKHRILLGAVRKEQNPFTGRTLLHRKDVVKPVMMYEYGTFRPTLTTRAPAAYYVPADLEVAVDRIRAHGIRYDTLAADTTLTLERFRIDSVHVAEESYQGHRQQTLFGAYEPAEVTLSAGTLVVPVDQPLGRLAVFLLEPQSDDGLANWHLIEAEPGTYYPIVRCPGSSNGAANSCGERSRYGH